MRKPFSRISIVLITVLFITPFSSAGQKDMGKKNTEVVYRVFSELEQLLCKHITSTGDTGVCIIIEPIGDFSSPKDSVDNKYVYRISLRFSSSYKKDSIFKITNRKMEICNKLYPVYLARIDDVFCVSHDEVNVPYRHGRLMEAIDIYYLGDCIVDMSKKKIFYLMSSLKP